MRRGHVAMRLAVAAVLLAGCVGSPPGEEARVWNLRVSFTPGYTEAEKDEVCRILECEGFEASDPVRTSKWFPTEEACQRARERVVAVTNATASVCLRGGPPMLWTVHGSFTPGYAPEDVEAVCRAATGNATCALMKSEPPQFAFTYGDPEACEATRAAIAAVPHTRVPEQCSTGRSG